MQHGCLYPFFVHPLCHLEVVTPSFVSVCVFCIQVLWVFGCYIEVMNGHGIEKKEVNSM
jgi:hypothetical protein